MEQQTDKKKKSIQGSAQSLVKRSAYVKQLERSKFMFRGTLNPLSGQKSRWSENEGALSKSNKSRRPSKGETERLKYRVAIKFATVDIRYAKNCSGQTMWSTPTVLTACEQNPAP